MEATRGGAALVLRPLKGPVIPSRLRAKASEVESHIEDRGGGPANAGADLVHVVATMRMGDPFDRCKGAMKATPEPQSTRELAQAVILAQGRDSDDRGFGPTTAHRIGTMTIRFQDRTLVEGERGGAVADDSKVVSFSSWVILPRVASVDRRSARTAVHAGSLKDG